MVVYFVTPRKGKPPRAITATDLADFYICPRRFLYRKVFGQKPNYAMLKGMQAHVKKYNEHKARAKTRIELGTAVDMAAAGDELIGREVEVFGNGIYGIIDEVRLYQGEAVVVDFKSALSPRGKLQVLAYASALKALGCSQITVQITRTNDGEVLWEKSFSDDDYWMVESVKQRFYSAVRSGIFPKKAEHNSCKTCPFAKMCGTTAPI